MVDSTESLVELCTDGDCHNSIDSPLPVADNFTSLFNLTSNYSNMTVEPAIKYMDPSYYAIPYRIIGTIFQGFILIVGVLGNIMVVIVVTRTRSMKTPTNCYLVSLSIADLMVLISSVPNEIIAYYLIGDKWIWGPIGCGLFIFFQYFGINASSLSITAFTIERYIAICHPMRAQKMCTVHRAKRIIASVWIFSFIYCSPWLFLTKTQKLYYKGHNNIETCTYALSRQYYKVFYFADLIIFYVFPLLLSCVLYGLIAKILFNNELTKGEGNSKSRNGHSTGMLADSKKSSTHGVDQARVQVVKMLVVVVAVFATLWLPYRCLVVYNSFADNRYMELCAINPIIYSACSMKFRRAFKKMLTCDRGNGQRRARAPHYSSGLSTTMHSVRQNHSLLTQGTLKTTSNLTLSNMEQGV